MDKEEYQEFKTMRRRDVYVKYAIKMGKGEIDREEYQRIVDLWEKANRGILDL